MTIRFVVVVAVVFGLGLAPRLWRQRVRRLHADQAPTPLVPAALLADAERTYVIFTTRFCAQCGPVEEHLRRTDPTARVVTIDAEREPQLAGRFRVKAAPTVLLADRAGRVQRRMVGAAAVRDSVTA